MRKIILITIIVLGWVAVARAAPAPALVDSAWLMANRDRADLVILDVRNKLGGGSLEAYQQGHIPGAIYSDYLRDGWRTKVNGVPGQLPPVADLEALIGGLGIDNSKHVVIVAGGTSALDMGSATRVYFTFKVLGHDAVSVLDGGYRAYASDPSNPIAMGTNVLAPTVFAADYRPEMIVNRQQVAALLDTETTLIDNRPYKQFRGEAKHPASKRAGTIPGSYSLPEAQLTENGGSFVSAERLGELLSEAGLAPDGEAVAFCNTGHWASLGWFVNSEILGNKNVRLYDGSMVDWSADEALPIQSQATVDSN